MDEEKKLNPVEEAKVDLEELRNWKLKQIAKQYLEEEKQLVSRLEGVREELKKIEDGTYVIAEPKTMTVCSGSWFSFPSVWTDIP